ncbi:BBT_collapsed_G0018170.mRNA.1.CDS.1 [Saccharomyces cerevisiae]|nr:BBT_collapsed_G0018170.mRNA.1.CDS.1 [Saccharomyces cerevisiae]
MFDILVVSWVFMCHSHACSNTWIATRYSFWGTLQRRISYFDVNWISRNWDNVNVDLNKEVKKSRPLLGEEDDQYMFGWFANNPGWKYYWSVTDNPDPGYIENYSDIGDENAVHGELYFNTYGGLMASVMTTKMVLNAQRQLVVIDTIVVTAICDYVMKYWKKKVNLTTISLYLMLKL